MNDNEIKSKLIDFKKNNPKIKTITFNYYGSGDSFDSYDVDVEYINKKTKDYTVDTSSLEDVFWEMIERAGSNFNDDGSEGSVTFNIKELTVNIRDYYIFRDSQLNAEIDVK